jgi:hypothetical protein
MRKRGARATGARVRTRALRSRVARLYGAREREQQRAQSHEQDRSVLEGALEGALQGGLRSFLVRVFGCVACTVIHIWVYRARIHPLGIRGRAAAGWARKWRGRDGRRVGVMGKSQRVCA